MDNRVYCTSAIGSVKVQVNEKVATYVWVPHYRAVQDRRFFGTKLITCGNGWAKEEDVNSALQLRHLDAWLLKEDYKCYQDMSKVSGESLDLACGVPYSDVIKNSNFHKWFNDGHDTDGWYYECETDSIGVIKKIHVWRKGDVTISFHDGWSSDIFFPKNIPDDNVAEEEVKKILQGIQNYRFFKVIDDNVEFFNVE